MGIIVGLTIALFSGFNWWMVAKGPIVGTIIGFGAEVFGKVSGKVKNS